MAGALPRDKSDDNDQDKNKKNESLKFLKTYPRNINEIGTDGFRGPADSVITPVFLPKAWISYWRCN